MKLFILIVAITWSNAAKLDNTYLPPTSAQSAGGSGRFLQTPFPGSSHAHNNEESFPRRVSNFAQNDHTFAQSGNAFPQNGNDFAQSNDYAQRGNGFTQERNDQYNGFNGFDARPERAQAAFERNAAILRQDNQNDGETYSYAYETENGITAEESGVATNGVEAQGGFSYTGDDGQVYSIRYTADQNGFVPQGDHLPTPPPVPEEILRALEQNARDEAAGIYDDGSYNEAKYSSGDDYNTNANRNINNYNENTFNQEQGDDDSVVTNSALFPSPSNSRGFNQGFDGSLQGHQGADSKAYLPPLASQRTTTFGSRGRPQSFSSRNGYRY